jgi:hypothetical protein
VPVLFLHAAAHDDEIPVLRVDDAQNVGSGDTPVRAEHPDGDYKIYLEGPPGSERRVRISYPSGRQEFLEGARGEQHDVLMVVSEYLRKSIQALVCMPQLWLRCSDHDCNHFVHRLGFPCFCSGGVHWCHEIARMRLLRMLGEREDEGPPAT